MDFKIFGHVSVRLGGEWLAEWEKSKKIRGALGVLLAHPQRTLPVNGIIQWLWGQNADLEAHSKTLQGYVAKARRIIATLDPSLTVKFVNGGYRLDIDPRRVDYHHARELLANARVAKRESDHDRAWALFAEVLELTLDPPLIDLNTGRAEDFRKRTEANLVLPAHYELMESQLALGAPEEVLATLDELQPDHEFSVTLAKRRIDALLATDRRSQATEYYMSARKSFQHQELDDEADDLLAYWNSLSHKRDEVRPSKKEGLARRDGPRLLPREHGELAGREDQLAALNAYTENGSAAQVVVLSGTPGIGKTALALHWAHQVRNRFPTYYYRDLHGFSNSPPLETEDLIRLLLHEFGIPADLIGDDEARLARLSVELGQRRILFVLDNVADVQQITKFLDVAPDALVLITSRRQLDHLSLHYGALDISVPMVDSEAAKEWLSATIGDRCIREPVALNELVELCGGIPLAFRLVGRYAVARPNMSLSEIARFIREEHRLLDVRGSVDEEQSSLRASFALSYHALPEPAQRVFRRAGLFPMSRISLDAVVALAALPRAVVLASLDVLVQFNLVEQKTSGFQLHDLLHDFAAERVVAEEDPDERERAMTGLLDFYLHTANNAERAVLDYWPAVPVLPCRTDIEPREFLDHQEAFRFYIEERHALVALVRMAHQNHFDRYSWRLASIISEPLKRHGHYREVRECYELALASAHAVGERDGESNCLNGLGHISMETREFDSAFDYFLSAYLMCQEIGENHGAAVALHNMAFQRLRIKDLDSAERLCNDALEYERKYDLDHVRATTFACLGQVYVARGDLRSANIVFHQALNLEERADSTFGTGRVLGHLSRLHQVRGDTQAAIDFGRRAMQCHLASQDLAGLARTLCTVAAALRARADHVEAREHAREAIRICWRVGGLETEATALDILAATLAEADCREAALEGWQRAGAIFHDIGDERWNAVRLRLNGIGSDLS